MLIVVDIGNTNVVLGAYRADKLVASWRLSTRTETTEDEYSVMIRNLFQQAEIDRAQVSGVIIASVVPPLVRAFANLAQRCFGLEPMIVGPGLKTGMPILYDNPREVGADRIVNAVAAWHERRSALVIVDFGTATTFDVVSPKGEYLGGAIAPGVGISMDALFTHTAKLPRVEFAQPKSVIGKTTVHSIQAGIYFGYVGMVDAIVERIINEMRQPCFVMATGGLARLIAPDSRTVKHVDDELTLKGLRLIYHMNAKTPSVEPRP